jgi:hypothetical protein
MKGTNGFSLFFLSVYMFYETAMKIVTIKKWLANVVKCALKVFSCH